MNYYNIIGAGVLVALVLIAGTIYYLLIYKNSEKYWNKIKFQVELQKRFKQMKEFIKKEVSQGKQRLDIEIQLLKCGWKKKQIKQAFKQNLKESVIYDRYQKEYGQQNQFPEVPTEDKRSTTATGESGTRATEPARIDDAGDSTVAEQRSVQARPIGNTKPTDSSPKQNSSLLRKIINRRIKQRS